jgi:hypothetical protein
VFRLECAELEIDGDKAAETAMKQQQVDVVVPIARSDSELPGDEAKVAAQLEQKVLEMIDQSTLQIVLARDRVSLDAQELEHVRILKLRCGRV